MYKYILRFKTYSGLDISQVFAPFLLLIVNSIPIVQSAPDSIFPAPVCGRETTGVRATVGFSMEHAHTSRLSFMTSLFAWRKKLQLLLLIESVCKEDHRSYLRHLCNHEKKAWNNRPFAGFGHVTIFNQKLWDRALKMP